MAINSNANLITTSKVTKETLMQLVNNLVLTNKADWKYSDEFAREAEQIGDTLSIRRPILTSIREDNMTWTGNLPYEGKVQLTIDKSFTADLKFNDADLSLKIEKFSERFIKQAVTMLANKIDVYVYGKVQNSTYWSIGQYGSDITSDSILAAKELLDASNCPDDGEIYGILTPRQNRSLSNVQLTLFNAQKEISEIYRKGRIGEFANIEFAWSNSSPTHRDGSVWAGAVGSITVSAAALTSGWAESSTISVAGFTAGRTLKAGDVFTLSGANGIVYNYNPLTKAQTPYVQQFVVLEDVASVTSAAQSVKIAPALITSGDYQSVVDVTGTVSLINHSNTSATIGQEGLIFHKEAIAVASPKLVLPKNIDQGNSMVGSEEDDVTGIKIRYIRSFDAVNANFITRLDNFMGAKVVRPEWVIRLR